jgi:hypothetical protein
VLALFVLAPSAHALPDCPDMPQQRTILTGQGQLESIIADARGRLFYSDLQNGGRLLRVERPDANPKVLIQGVDGSGGLAWEPDGSLVFGFNGGNDNATVDGPDGGLLRVNPETGKYTVLASGMGMANGVVRGPDGAIYASNDFAGGIDKVVGGKVQDDWAKTVTPNGLVIDTAGRYLYAAQTFKPASIARIDLRDPAREEPYYEAPPADAAGGPDGMTRDERNRLFVAVNATGEVWRVDTDRSACVVARGIGNASAVNWGGGGPGFPARNLYVVGFSGVLVELANATDAPPPAGPPAAAAVETPRLRVSVTPKRSPRRRRTLFSFRVSDAGHGGTTVRGATVRFAGRKLTTDAGGRATVRVRFFHAGVKKVRASQTGYRVGKTTVRITSSPKG